MKILCVEDGSVDIQELEENGVQEGKVLVYRQGSTPPFVLDVPNNMCHLSKEKIKAIEVFLETKQIFIDTCSSLKGEDRLLIRTVLLNLECLEKRLGLKGE